MLQNKYVHELQHKEGGAEIRRKSEINSGLPDQQRCSILLLRCTVAYPQFQDAVLGLPFALVEEHRALRVLPCGDRLGEAAREHRKSVLDTLFDIKLLHQPEKTGSTPRHPRHGEAQDKETFGYPGALTVVTCW